MSLQAWGMEAHGEESPCSLTAEVRDEFAQPFFALMCISKRVTEFKEFYCPWQLMTTLPFVWPTCLRTPVRQTCRSSLDHLAPSPGSIWPRIRTQASQRSVLILQKVLFPFIILFFFSSSSLHWFNKRMCSWVNDQLALLICCFLQGFAFISFHRREDAARAIAGVSGFGYDHLILNVEWAK